MKRGSVASVYLKKQVKNALRIEFIYHQHVFQCIFVVKIGLHKKYCSIHSCES